MRRKEQVRSVIFYSLNIIDLQFQKRFRKTRNRPGKKKPVMGGTGFLFPLLETLRKMKSEKVWKRVKVPFPFSINTTLTLPKRFQKKYFFSFSGLAL
jgi:hypothetical protein